MTDHFDHATGEGVNTGRGKCRFFWTHLKILVASMFEGFGCGQYELSIIFHFTIFHSLLTFVSAAWPFFFTKNHLNNNNGIFEYIIHSSLT